MKNFKPQKQTVLKALLLLTIGLNFSWEPLFGDHHQASFSSDGVKKDKDKDKSEAHGKSDDKAKGVTIEVGGPADPYKGKVLKACDVNFGMKLMPNGTLALTHIDDKNHESVCEKCTISAVGDVQDKNAVDRVWEQVTTKLLATSCEELLTEKELAERKALAIDILKCERNEEGETLEGAKKLKCEKKNMNASNSRFKELGIDKDEANDIRADLKKDFEKTTYDENLALEKASYKEMATACRKAAKSEDSFDECRDLQDKHAELLEKMGMIDNEKLAKLVTYESKKLDSFKKLSEDEQRASSNLAQQDKKLDRIISGLEYGRQANQDKCDRAASQAEAYNQAFNVDACVETSNNILAQQWAPTIKQLSTSFIKQENAYDSVLKKASQLEYFGPEGESTALQPYRDFRDKLVNLAQEYGVAASNVPSPDPSSSASSTLGSSGRTSGRSSIGSVTPATSFTPDRLGVANGRPMVSGSINPPAILSQSNPGARQYNSMRPAAQQNTTSGMTPLGGVGRGVVVELI